jgi:uncharacterized lipoprotein
MRIEVKQMKKIAFIAIVMMLAACSAKAPEPKQAKGDWYDLNTTSQAIKAGTY